MPVVTCNTLTLTLDEPACRAVSLVNRATGVELLGTASHPVGLWELSLSRPVSFDDPLPPIERPEVEYDGHEWLANRNEYDADLIVDSNDAAAPIVSGDEQGLTLTWSMPVDGGAAVVTLQIVGGDRESLDFTGCVSVPDGWMIRNSAWPRMRGFGDLAAPEQDALLFPYNFGILRKNPLEDMTSKAGQYPGGAQWGQFTSWMHGETGLFLGLRDGECNHTGIEATYVEGDTPAPKRVNRWYVNQDVPAWKTRDPLALNERPDPSFQFTVRHWPTQGNSWSSTYPVVLQGFEGTWYEAAMIYREWALQQRWCRHGRIADRPTKTAAQDLDLWFCRYGFPPWEMTPGDASEMLKAMHRLRDFMGQPFGVHWYHWHAFNWHRNYPTHSPVVEGFGEAVKELQARDVVIMPYCQGRLLYQNRPTIETDRSHACVEANGQPYMEQYTPQDDWPLALCTHDIWSQQQWYEAARLLWRQYGVEGVYYDQISAMMPSLCYHKGHGHALGGGSQTWEGYDASLSLLDPMKEEDPRRFVASECLTDAYMDRLDMYLAFVPPLEDYVPAWSAVYGGYTLTMGRSTPDAVMQDQQLMVICQGEQLIFGAQLGWMDQRLLNYPEAAAFLRDSASLRSHLRAFLVEGHMLAPLTLSTNPGEMTVTMPGAMCAREADLTVTRCPVMHTVWEDSQGRRLVMLLNESRESVDTSFQVPASWGATACTHVQGGNVPVVKGSVAATLEPLSVTALILS